MRSQTLNTINSGLTCSGSSLACYKLIIGLCALLATSAAFNVSAQAANFIYADEYLYYELPEAVTEVCYSLEGYNCPQISITYANSDQHWLNTLINSRINQLLPDDNPDYRPTIKPPMMSQTAVKKQLDGFALSQLKDIPEDSSLYYDFSAEPNYIGHIGDIELFDITTYIYLGGAHGLGYTEYMMLDTSTKQQLLLNDILIKGTQQKFESLAYTEYKKWIKNVDDDTESYERMWPFEFSDNVLLTNKGLVIKYQPYQIASYANGMPELTVPYHKLKGILKQRYLELATQ